MTKRKSTKPSVEKPVRDIRRATRRKYFTEEKIRIVMEGLGAKESNGGRRCYWVSQADQAVLF